MLVRYGKNSKNKTIRLAEIYTKEEHEISKKDIDRDALNITRRLHSYGYEAYIVGGAVRDLLVGKNPNDFDLVTNATPGKIRKIFRNSRIIGKRFKLVHVFFGRGKNIEVSTFRSSNSGAWDEQFGTIDEDAKRRDFSINALYYCPHREQVFDYVDGVKDLKDKKLTSLIPLHHTFKEDPVRMIRAIKYSSVLNLNIPSTLRKAIKRNAHLLEDCSKSRLTEEIFKIYKTNNSFIIFKAFVQFNLFKYFQPVYNNILRNKQLRNSFFNDLMNLDVISKSNNKFDNRKKSIYLYCRQGLLNCKNFTIEQIHKQFYLKIKELMHPLTPPNMDVDGAVRMYMQEKGLRHSRMHYGKITAVSK